MSNEMIEMEASAFHAVKLYYERRPEDLKKRLVYMATEPSYKYICEWSWWKCFMIDASAYLKAQGILGTM